MEQHTCLACGQAMIEIRGNIYFCQVCGTEYGPDNIVSCERCGEKCLTDSNLAVPICPKCRGHYLK